MKYSFKQINQSRFDKERSQTRKMAELFIPLNLLGKIIAPLPAYIFLNLGIHPDLVTFFSMLAVLTGSIFLFFGQPIVGVSFFLLFILFDSVDGDMARVRGPSSYGSVLDSFGADVFYSLGPLSIGYYLFQIETNLGRLSAPFVLLLAALVSLSFILYRLVNTKVFHWRRKFTNEETNHNQVAKAAMPVKGIVKFFELGRHVLVRGNFFSEPGLVFWFFILILAQQLKALAWYLIIVLLYNSVYLLFNFAGAYLYFRQSERGGEK